MWQRASDRTNPAARALFAGLVMLWGGVRLIGAVYLYDDTKEDKKEGVRLIVMWTYALESIMLSIAAATGQMREERAFVAAALCVPMLILLRLFAFDDDDDYH
jgi:phosphatidylserine synthase